MATCDECRWNVERHECPWNFQYIDTDYAEDCIDFRDIYWYRDAFTYDKSEQKKGNINNETV